MSAAEKQPWEWQCYLVAGGVRDQYAGHPLGADGWYRDHGATYRNPHEDAVTAMIERSVRQFPDRYQSGLVLDLAAGSGEVTLALRSCGVDPLMIEACDPYTVSAYAARVGSPCSTMSFADVARGDLAGRRYSAVICSYALHLCEPSRLPLVCAQLAAVADMLVVITPHKRPEIDAAWGWRLADEYRDGGYRVRLRHYLSHEPALHNDRQ
jgi:hypothetical protein